MAGFSIWLTGDALLHLEGNHEWKIEVSKCNFCRKETRRTERMNRENKIAVAIVLVNGETDHSQYY